jgi:hypothetical protein
MMMTIPRAAFGVFALLFTVATVDVARARAQTTTVTPTVCGAGTLRACGSEPITKCESSVSFDVNLLLQSGGFKWTTSNCTTGYKTLYKDVPSTGTTGTTGAKTTGSCGGSTGTGLTGMRGSGEDEETILLCED